MERDLFIASKAIQPEKNTQNQMITALQSRVAAAEAAKPTFNGVDFDAMPPAYAMLAKHGRAMARVRTGQAITAALQRAKVGDALGAWVVAGSGAGWGSPAARYFHRRA
jgi:hypothetical protein